jgi:5,10-methylenetetrahydromethanopterin reductase
MAAVSADRVVFALGADPERLSWGIEVARDARRAAGLDPDAQRYGAYLNVGCHPDPVVARDLVRGGLSTFARFSVMHGEVVGPATADQRAVLDHLHDGYDMRSHTRADSAQAGGLPDGFVDRFAIIGDPQRCRDRLGELAGLGIDKAVLIGPTAGADRAAVATSSALLEAEVVGQRDL